jgi:hypothetical protein
MKCAGRRGGHQQRAAHGAGSHAPQHGDLGAGAVEMRPAQGRLARVAMYWMLMTSPASTAL